MNQFKEKFGIHWLELFALSLLGVPRIILHDISLIREGEFINALFVFLPIIVWIAYVTLRRVSRPFMAMMILCLIYGVLLAVTHQIMWAEVFPGGIVLGGNLSNLNGVTEIIARVLAFFSSLATGAVLGIILGSATWAINLILNKTGEKRHEN